MEPNGADRRVEEVRFADRGAAPPDLGSASLPGIGRPLDLELRNLPKPGSREYAAILDDLKCQVTSRSFAQLDLSAYITPEYGTAWFESLPHDGASQMNGGQILYTRDGSLKREPPAPWQIEAAGNLHQFLAGLLREGLPSEIPIDEGFMNVRLIVPSDRCTAFDEWHADGGYAAVTIAFLGEGTERLGLAPKMPSYMDYHNHRGESWEQLCTAQERSVVPRGHALIFFGSSAGSQGMIDPLIHRTPRDIGDRVLAVHRF